MIPGETATLTLLRAERGLCRRCGLPSEGYAAEGDDGKQRLLCLPCIQAIEPGRVVPEPFGRRVLLADRNGWRPPPTAGSPEESAETARIVGCGGCGGREE
jgi:hypothetical protein